MSNCTPSVFLHLSPSLSLPSALLDPPFREEAEKIMQQAASNAAERREKYENMLIEQHVPHKLDVDVSFNSKRMLLKVGPEPRRCDRCTHNSLVTKECNTPPSAAIRPSTTRKRRSTWSCWAPPEAGGRSVQWTP